jgi:mannosyltransferase
MFVSGRYIDWHLDPAIPAPLPVLLGVVAGAAILLSVSRADARRTTADDATDRNDHHGSGSSLPRDGLAPVWLLTLLAVVPVAAPFVISKAITPILVLRYTLPASLGVYLLIGRGMGAVRPSAVRYLLVALLVAGMVVPLPTYYGADQKAQWREAASFVEGVTDEDDLVVLAPGHVWWPFHYYFDGPAEIETADASTSTGELREMARGHDRVVLVFRYPGDATRDRLRSALREGPNPRSPTERSYVVVSVVTYENSTAT